MSEPTKDSLSSVKTELRSRFLGRGGIHGFGIDRGAEAIKVYLDPGADADRQATLEAVERAASPYRVILVEEAAPRATKGR